VRRSLPERPSSTNTETTVGPAAVRNELERIAESPSFRKAERCLRLLRHVTTLKLEGRGSELKEYSLGVTVFERPESYDPRTDPVVRLEARRLRLKLAEYYQQEGLDDPVVIDLPKGGYVPGFRSRQTFSGVPAAPAKRRRRIPIWAAAAAAVVLSIAAAASFAIHKRESPAVRSSVAVLGFQDLSPLPETAWIASALSEAMNIELGAGQQLQTLPLENVARMRTELSLTPQATYPARMLRRIRANLGIDYAVAGAYLTRGDRVRLDVVLFDVRSGQQIAAITEEAAQDKLSALIEGCTRRIRAHLGVRLLSTDSGSPYPPVENRATESYARGMERLRQSDALTALPYLETAASDAPANASAHSALAAAWSMLGLDNQALREAKLALDCSAGLGRVEQLEIEGRYREIAREWQRAIQVYQALFTLLPDDLENGLRLASVQTRGGKAQDAFGTISALRGLPPPLRDDPRIDFAEAQTAGALSDFVRTRKAAHIAAEKAGQNGARLQYARARLLESGAMQVLGIAGFPDVRAEARRICAELGDRACVAAAYRIEANYMAATGDLTAARPLYAAALEIANEMGNRLEKLNALTGLAFTERLQGDLRAAEADYRTALAVGSEMGPLKSYPACLDLAAVLAAEGRIAESRALSEQALDVSRQLGEREGIGLSQSALAHALALEGKFPDAVARYNEAIGVLRDVQGPRELGVTLLDLGDVQIEQGNLAAARKSYEETRALDRQFRDGFARPEIELAFARLNLAGGEAGEAAVHARVAMNAFARAGREGDRLEAAAMLMRALVARGSIGEASGVLRQIPSPDGKQLPVRAVVQFRIARCLVLANSGARAEAVRSMDSLIAEVARLGLRPLEKEARLAREAVAKTAASDSGARETASAPPG
jgi:tetratricopeptide (TPR) repeat protein